MSDISTNIETYFELVVCMLRLHHIVQLQTDILSKIKLPTVQRGEFFDAVLSRRNLDRLKQGIAEHSHCSSACVEKDLPGMFAESVKSACKLFWGDITFRNDGFIQLVTI